jgi:response regulator NasT
LRQALSDRKVIERAKGILMKRAGLDPEEAFRRLQKLARDHNQRIVDASHIILRADEAFPSPEP